MLKIKCIENVRYTTIAYLNICTLLPIGSYIIIKDIQYKVINYVISSKENYYGEDINICNMILKRASNKDIKYNELIGNDL